MNIEEIMQILPHRYPFLMVDRILELVPGKKAVGIKNVSINEPFFGGHFPHKPVMPGVLLIEAMAQAGACALLSDERYEGHLVYLAGVDKIRFKQMAVPGDCLYITAELLTVKGTIGKGKGEIKCGGKLVCGGEFLFAISS
jgi:3-hydroxyacyl-[acyl-carrier-protein] dehydratase